jgi:hypothetical protein
VRAPHCGTKPDTYKHLNADDRVPFDIEATAKIVCETRSTPERGLLLMTSASDRATALLDDPDLAGPPWVDDGVSIGSQAPIHGNVVCLQPQPPAFADSHVRWPANKRFIVACRGLVPELLEELSTCREALSKTRIEADRAITDATFARAELKQAHAQILKLAMDLDEAKARSAKDDAGVTIHACPPRGAGLMPCCGKTPFEVMGDRMTSNPAHVNCDRARLLAENDRLKNERL